MMADQTDYDVGYGKPPKHSQFKPGQSGNPAGRSKGARGIKAELLAALDSRYTIQINKRPVTASRQRLIFETLTIRAASGDLKAQQVVISTMMQVLGVEDRGMGKTKLSPNDQAILNELLAGLTVGDDVEISDDCSDQPHDDNEQRRDDDAS